jgi:hypothetical protein
VNYEEIEKDAAKVERQIIEALQWLFQAKQKVDDAAEDRKMEWGEGEVCVVIKAGDREIDMTYAEITRAASVRFVLTEHLRTIKEEYLKQTRESAKQTAESMLDAARGACILCAAGTPLDLEVRKHVVSDKQREYCTAFPFRKAAQFVSHSGR